MSRTWKNSYQRNDQLTLVAPDLAAHLGDRASPARQPLIDFFRSLALCHGVLAETADDAPHILNYKAESPDEAALLSCARDVGFAFVRKSNSIIEISVLGSPERYVPLRV